MDESQLIQCPYEKSHRILPFRFQVHLGRCRKNHQNVPKVACPFNVSHVLNKPELEYHVTVCPERLSFEQFKIREQCATQNQPQTETVTSAVETGPTNSDDEPDYPTYNPQAYAANSKVLRSIKGATPSQRKEFRKQERLRLLGVNK